MDTAAQMHYAAVEALTCEMDTLISPQVNTHCMQTLLDGLPRGLLLASSVTLEGAVQFLKTVPLHEPSRCVVASYDWNPFASFLRFPVHLMFPTARRTAPPHLTSQSGKNAMA